MKKFFKGLFTTLSILFGVVLLAVAGALGYLILPVLDYYKVSSKAFEIPGLKDGFVPQGLDFYQDDNGKYFLITGYMNDGSASRIYQVNQETGALVKYVTLNDHDGKAFAGHNGGIAIENDIVFIAGSSDSCLYVYSLSEITNVETSSVNQVGTFSLKSANDEIRASFVTIKDRRLITGEFYKEEDYETPESHHLSGDTSNKAIAVEYMLPDLTLVKNLSAQLELALLNSAFYNTPICGYSLPDKVQGMELNGNTIYCSTSWGLSHSHIYGYDISESTPIFKTILDNDLPVYVLNGTNQTKDLKLAPMSEEIKIVGNYMFVMCESASKKYIFGNFTGATYCFATDITKF